MPMISFDAMRCEIVLRKSLFNEMGMVHFLETQKRASNRSGIEATMDLFF